ncbi:MAG: cytochrome c maturation protein CcmE [Alphaproteobacteria bacterium]|nr:MAG: cytochrome c maturation protein CcmE [Alphaproteobacteria bacterium]
MASLRKRRRIQLIVLAFVALAVATGIFAYAMRDAVQFFRTPSEVMASPPPPSEVFRIGGLVEKGSLVRDEGETIRFRVTDGEQTVEVRYTGVLPDLFGEGQGVVATGRLEGGVFIAEEILAKHDENYMPREVIDALKDKGLYQPPNGS